MLIGKQAEASGDFRLWRRLLVGAPPENDARIRGRWVGRSATGLDLRHVHRHADGRALSQSFFADAYSAKLIKGSVTNVWTISLSADKNTLTCHLERAAKPRVEAVLKRVSR
jgi:hypothetical protein